VYHDGAFIAWFAALFLPGEVHIALFVVLHVVRQAVQLVAHFLYNVGLDVFGHLLQVESDWQTEVQLNCAALVFAVQRVEHLNVNFGAVKCAIAWVQLPLLAESVQGILQFLLSFLPQSVRPDGLLGFGAELQLLCKSEYTLDIVQEV